MFQLRPTEILLGAQAVVSMAEELQVLGGVRAPVGPWLSMMELQKGARAAWGSIFANERATKPVPRQ